MKEREDKERKDLQEKKINTLRVGSMQHMCNAGQPSIIGKLRWFMKGRSLFSNTTFLSFMMSTKLASTSITGGRDASLSGSTVGDLV
jgi:hypothetical protein